MRKNSFFTASILWAAAAMLSVSCNVNGIAYNSGGSDDVLYELAGRWYNNRHDFVFEITQAGEAYIAESRTQCAVSVSGRYVSFKDSRGYSLGSFRYSIRNNALTLTYGTGAFSDMPSASPFIKFGSVPAGGAVPVELISAWYAKSRPPETPNFVIDPSGGMTISGSETSYTAIVSGNRVSVLEGEGSILRGAFRYSVIYGEMVVTNGTDICAGLAVLSPFVEQ